jgi:hypothetical protein
MSRGCEGFGGCNESTDAPAPVVGVFGSEEEAMSFVDAHVPTRFEELAIGQYAVGWTYSEGSRPYIR